MTMLTIEQLSYLLKFAIQKMKQPGVRTQFLLALVTRVEPASFCALNIFVPCNHSFFRHLVFFFTLWAFWVPEFKFLSVKSKVPWQAANSFCVFEESNREITWTRKLAGI